MTCIAQRKYHFCPYQLLAFTSNIPFHPFQYHPPQLTFHQHRKKLPIAGINCLMLFPQLLKLHIIYVIVFIH